MRVFITGATGFLGSHVAERLRRRGDEVVALVRDTSDTTHLDGLGCETVVGDVMDPVDELAARMRGADAVVHAAARVFQAGSRKAFLRTNTEGTDRVLRAAGRAAPRVVHLSSVAVYATLAMDDPLTEERWTEADPDRQAAYAASKHLSERAAWRLHEQGRIRLTTVRPCVVYGERDRAATPVIVRVVGRPVVPLVGGGRTTLPLVYAGNVARGIVATLDRDRAVGRAYNLARDTPITGRQLVDRVAGHLGRSPRILPVSPAVAGAGAAALEVVTGALPFVRRSDARRAVRALSHDNPYDSTRARLELGWGRHVSHEEGLRRTMEWWDQR
ncbi:MAG: NAD-dependent epimerase/dehydratase family protein [Longimicrobiales bacterium]|nr:NAD-dependent epimerase/dehydratase family protein [Longimicrobiales bacterium]